MGVEEKGGWAGEGSTRRGVVKLRDGCGGRRREIVRTPQRLLITPPPFSVHTLRHIRERDGFREGDADNGDAGRAQEGKPCPFSALLWSH